MTAQDNSTYKRAYGAWAGFPKGHHPDFTRCCEEVGFEQRGAQHHQCGKPRGHGPFLAYCKVHDPAARAAREEKSRKAYYEQRNKERVQFAGPRFLEALREIAAGHNDARTFAQGIVEAFDKEERKP